MDLMGSVTAIRAVSDRSIAELISLEGRRALVTGGARGIGFAVAHRLVEAGAEVVVGDVDEAAATSAARAITHQGGTAIGTGLDVRSTESVRATIRTVVDEFGSIDILVNNGASFPPVPSLQVTDALWDEMLSVNLDGTFKTSREVARWMTDAGTGGVIVNICPPYSPRSRGTGLAAHTAAKQALIGLTQALAQELGPSGIRVLGVAPFLTQVTAAPEILDRTMISLPLGRVAQADDVARVVLFAASDMAMIMTGSVLLADAGAMTV
jgi:NAD(P)-dependent dehydrogenase (short-subunit alcohol dehydrogenase family)